ncbi:MAG: M20/M25/M40 family metallo-hydrolase [Myxococcales bacterium]|nr:M20/M25/M40 family metallo-hydrolase [Myxococcales bacterium]
MDSADTEKKPKRGAGAAKKKRKSLARRLLRVVVLLWLALLLVTGCILMWRTSGFTSSQRPATPVKVEISGPAARIERLAQAIRIQTISDGSGPPPATNLFALHEHLRVSFPRVHQSLVRENISEYSLLYTWKGKQPNLPALILAGHLDVVPADPKRWSHDPFAGTVDGSHLYGRGTMDDKVTVMALLEAVELLLEEGVIPERTIYLAFGHDEEVGGYEGAKIIADILELRGVVAEATIDEGMVITEGIMDGISDPVALVGIAEKGFMNLELLVTGAGGHSSMPPRKTAVGILSRAILRLQNNPMPGTFASSVRQMLEAVGPEFGYGRRLVMANLWLFGGMVKSSFSEKLATDALLRTTIAPTMLEGSSKENVLAQEARAVVNLRIKPGDAEESVLAHMRTAIDDPRVVLRVMEMVPPQTSSSSKSRVFHIIEDTLRSIDPSIIVAPGLMLALTDSRHYSKISTDIYRFTAMRLGPEDLQRLHGVDERISLSNYIEIIAFNRRLIRAAAQ